MFSLEYVIVDLVKPKGGRNVAKLKWATYEQQAICKKGLEKGVKMHKENGPKNIKNCNEMRQKGNKTVSLNVQKYKKSSRERPPKYSKSSLQKPKKCSKSIPKYFFYTIITF